MQETPISDENRKTTDSIDSKLNTNLRVPGIIGAAWGILILVMGVVVILLGVFFGNYHNIERIMLIGIVVLAIGGLVFFIGMITFAIGYSQSTSSQSGVSHSETTEKMKTCPQCAESIREAAMICRFCGHQYANGKIPS
jgi:hypothetical protein